ncbi:MAG: hypothetical protein WA828_16975 [Coleofasciculaceae cyanobacterium]
MIVNPSSNLKLERIESLKAGILAAFCLTISYSLLTLAHQLLPFEPLAALQITSMSSFGLKVAIAFINGFLFGITYRYVIREDDNSHLSEGAVLAFGIVRGLALVEATPDLIGSFWVLSLLGTESILYFTIARWLLDWAIGKHWLKPFKTN